MTRVVDNELVDIIRDEMLRDDFEMTEDEILFLHDAILSAADVLIDKYSDKIGELQRLIDDISERAGTYYDDEVGQHRIKGYDNEFLVEAHLARIAELEKKIKTLQGGK